MFNLGLGTLFVRIKAEAEQYHQEMEKVTGSFDRVSSKMSTFGRRFSFALSAPIAAFSARAIKNFADIDQAITEASAVFGNVNERMRQEMIDTARVLSTETRFASADLANQFVTLARAGVSVENSLAALRTHALFAQAGMVELNQATELLNDSLAALGVAKTATDRLSQLNRLANLLVGASIESQASIDELALSLTRKAGAAIRVTNIGWEEGIALLSVYADQGLKGAIAGERVDIVLRELQKAQVKSAAAWEAMGLKTEEAGKGMRPMADIIEDISDRLEGMSPLTKFATLQTLGFEARSSAAIRSLIGMSDELRRYTQEAGRMGKVMEEVANAQMTSFANRLQTVRNEFVNVTQEVGRALAPALLDLVETFVELGKWFLSLSKGMQEFIVKAGLTAIALGPVILLVGNLMFALSNLSRGFRTVTQIVPMAVSLFGKLFKSLGAMKVATLGVATAVAASSGAIANTTSVAAAATKTASVSMIGSNATTATSFTGIGNSATSAATEVETATTRMAAASKAASAAIVATEAGLRSTTTGRFVKDPQLKLFKSTGRQLVPKTPPSKEITQFGSGVAKATTSMTIFAEKTAQSKGLILPWRMEVENAAKAAKQAGQLTLPLSSGILEVGESADKAKKVLTPVSYGMKDVAKESINAAKAMKGIEAPLGAVRDQFGRFATAITRFGKGKTAVSPFSVFVSDAEAAHKSTAKLVDAYGRVINKAEDAAAASKLILPGAAGAVSAFTPQLAGTTEQIEKIQKALAEVEKFDPKLLTSAVSKISVVDKIGEKGTRGLFRPGTNEIMIRADAGASTLVHELKHALQKAEGRIPTAGKRELTTAQINALEKEATEAANSFKTWQKSTDGLNRTMDKTSKIIVPGAAAIENTGRAAQKLILPVEFAGESAKKAAKQLTLFDAEVQKTAHTFSGASKQLQLFGDNFPVMEKPASRFSRVMSGMTSVFPTFTAGLNAVGRGAASAATGLKSMVSMRFGQAMAGANLAVGSLMASLQPLVILAVAAAVAKAAFEFTKWATGVNEANAAFDKAIAKGNELAGVLSRRDTRRQQGVMGEAQGMDPKERREFLVEQLERETKELRGQRAQLRGQETLVLNISQGWRAMLGSMMGGNKILESEQQNLEEIRARLEAQSIHVEELNAALKEANDQIKETSTGEFNLEDILEAEKMVGDLTREIELLDPSLSALDKELLAVKHTLEDLGDVDPETFRLVEEMLGKRASMQIANEAKSISDSLESQLRGFDAQELGMDTSFAETLFELEQMEEQFFLKGLMPPEEIQKAKDLLFQTEEARKRNVLFKESEGLKESLQNAAEEFDKQMKSIMDMQAEGFLEGEMFDRAKEEAEKSFEEGRLKELEEEDEKKGNGEIKFAGAFQQGSSEAFSQIIKSINQGRGVEAEAKRQTQVQMEMKRALDRIAEGVEGDEPAGLT